MIEPNTIHCGDCLDIMPQIADKSVDMVLCDLPYGTTDCKWDFIIPFDKLWEQYHRICKPNAPIVLFGAEPFSSALRFSNIKEYRYDWIWKKGETVSGHMNAHKMPLRNHEIISVFYRSLPTYNPIMRTGYQGYDKTKYNGQQVKDGVYGDKNIECHTENKGERFPLSVIDMSRDWKHQDALHPTQKPVDLLRYLILTYTNEGDVVLDNTMGSGSTIVAAIRENRQYIGIEKNEHYFEIAKKRIVAEKSQLSLF